MKKKTCLIFEGITVFYKTPRKHENQKKCFIRKFITVLKRSFKTQLQIFIQMSLRLFIFDNLQKNLARKKKTKDVLNNM